MRSYRQYCALAKALDVVGDRWNLLIVRELMLRGPCRYTDLLDGLPGIATNLLADRLRDLEGHGVIDREQAPPPIATTLFRLTDTGAELRPVLEAFGRWGARYMGQPADDDQFRAHWFAFPVGLLLRDSRPTDPPVTVELGTADGSVVVEAADGVVRTRPNRPRPADLGLAGPPSVILGLLAGQLTVTEARRRGLRTRGDIAVLDRLRPALVADSPASSSTRAEEVTS
jgi:DNA-binding HxlR family transcriptional regulator